MSRKRKRSRSSRHTWIILLAYWHRYVFLILSVVLPLMMARTRTDALTGMGIGMLSYGLYTLIGYLLRWKHIYCSFQSTAHQRMTPGDIRWRLIRKSDVYSDAGIFSGMGLALILVRLFIL